MSTITYNPNNPWPIPVLAKFMEIRESQGFHLIYKNGISRNPLYEYDLDRMGQIFHGWTVRLFMMVTSMQYAGVHIIKNDYRYGKVELYVGSSKDIVYTQRGKDPEQDGSLVVDVKPGDIFSFGMRVRKPDHHYLQGVANETEGPWMNVGAIRPADFKFKIRQNDHIILSIHLTYELTGQSPYLLPEYFDIPDSQQPPGSNMISKLKLINENAAIEVGIDPGNGTKFENYGIRKDLKESPLIYVYIRNLPDRYMITTNFDPQPKTILHQEYGKRNIWFHRGGNLETLSTTHYVLWDQ